MPIKISILSEFAFRALRANKLRSMLTMLGIIIGVAAVIVMMSIGQGAQHQVTARLSSLGTNLLTVRPGASGQFVRSGTVNTLTLDDVEAVRQLPGIKAAAPTVQGSELVTCGSKTWTTNITGTSPEAVEISSLNIEKGRFFDQADNAKASMVAVIGQTVYSNLYTQGANPVGTEIRINGEAYRVIGLLQAVGSSSAGGDQDDTVYIPVRTAQLRISGSKSINRMQVQVVSQEQMDSVESAITALLRKRHRLSSSQDDDFTIINMTQLLQQAQSISTILTMFLAGVAAISLIVGGIGVMNIMLVSVKERTREIGVRMAIGASRRDILNQFLLEAVILSLTGSIIGVGLGIAVSKLLSVFSSLTTVISVTSIFIAVGFALIVGIFFGYYPAQQASKLKPAEALSYE